MLQPIGDRQCRLLGGDGTAVRSVICSGCCVTLGFWGGKGSFQESPLASVGIALALHLAVPLGCSELGWPQPLGCAGARSDPSTNGSWNKSFCCNTQPGTFSGPKKPLGDACLVGTSLSPALPKVLAAPVGLSHVAAN